MVVFTCQHCGESLRKAAVEKHYYQHKRCRLNDPSLTCVDCLKDFFGNDYTSHISCVTEQQRYSAKGTVFKEGSGTKKQQLIMKIIEDLLASNGLSSDQRKLLDAISSFNNVPRKEKPFMNFISNVTRNSFKHAVSLSVFHLIEDGYKREREQENPINVTTSEPLSHGGDSLTENIGNTSQIGCPESLPKEKSGNENCSEDQEDSKENVTGLSKKEKKKQKKEEKYLALLENVKNEISEPVCDTSLSNGTEKIHKKSKKSKKLKQNEHEDIAMEIALEPEAKKEEMLSKKEKKRKLKDTEPEIMGKKTKLNSSEGEELMEAENQSQSFDWADVIVRVLQTKPEKELSLKRLRKKVISEFQTLKPTDHHTYDQLEAKFNKKVKKTPGVRVLNDRAKLNQIE